MRQERAEVTRNALIMAAAELFDSVGYERATLLGVSRAAAVSKGALAFHFGSKEELATTVRREACARAYQHAELVREKGQQPLQTLIDLTHLVAHQLTSEHLPRAAAKLTGELGGEGDPTVSPYALWRQILTDVAREAEKDGVFHPDTTAESLAELALRLVTGPPSEHPGDGERVHDRLAEHWQLLLVGLTHHAGALTSGLRLAGTERDWAAPSPRWSPQPLVSMR